ncbi:MAG TPA: DUF1993 domain-containing protein [Novosphingobium sp.]
MTLTDLIVPTYRQMLAALSAWLAKAEAQLPADRAAALPAARLAPDMFPLATQVRFACVQAYEAVARLRGEALPAAVGELLAEGRGAGERPGTLAEARARIAQVLALLDGLDPGALDGDPDRPLVHVLPDGTTFDLTAGQYARDWTLPQFYFHLMIAYALLRRAGVELGKVDYVAHMFAFLRPGTFPGG